MTTCVMKFGGTSVGSPERIRMAANRIEAEMKKWDRLVVVLSAMSGKTNDLLAFGYQFSQGLDTREVRRELDLLCSLGEQYTVAAMALELLARGVSAQTVLGFQVPILTDECHMNATIAAVECGRLNEVLGSGTIAIVPGFQGITKAGAVTTLGRGGSDTTAVAIAAALEADRCDIYTDVDGVYTTDPNLCPEARRIARISYEEMLEMASLGAKVLQTRSVFFAMAHQVPLVVRSSFSDEFGTWVTEEDESVESRLVSGITYDKNVAKVSVRGISDRAGIAARVFRPLADQGISVDMIVTNVDPSERTTLSFSVARADYERAINILKGALSDFGAEEIVGDRELSKVSIIGAGMRTHPGVATQMFEALASENINVKMISTSEIKISVLIDERYTELAVRVLHRAFL